jgi:simple sugar transport system permease protein
MEGFLDAVRALWTGSVGSWYALTSATLVRAIPLTLTGLAVATAFRAGVVNIGAEGQLLAGAAAATAGALLAAPLGAGALVVALAAGAAAGAAWAWPADLLRRRAGVLEVISTLLLNAVALALVGWLVRGPLQEPLGIYPQSDTISTTARLPALWRGTRLHAGLGVAVAAAVGLAWWARATAAGFRARAVGANAAAAASAGGIAVDVVRRRAPVAGSA